MQSPIWHKAPATGPEAWAATLADYLAANPLAAYALAVIVTAWAARWATRALF